MDEDELSSAEERGCTLSNVITVENIKSKKTFKLQNNPEYHLKIITNKHEKQKYSSITRFEEYNKNLKIAVNS